MLANTAYRNGYGRPLDKVPKRLWPDIRGGSRLMDRGMVLGIVGGLLAV